MAPFFNISFTSSLTNSFPSRLITGWGGIFDWKGFEWIGIFYPFTMSKILRSGVILIHAAKNVSIFLLMERLEYLLYLLTRIILLSMGEPFLIPTDLVFLDLSPCWRSFAVEQIFLPYLCCWLPVCP